ncbi:TetR/AcrR family transcriptional regulator [Paenactinomyces guangxiensis]|uniref:TetR/AcrR family transcriptional regulator n=1 Tax=Paenactinomyces guangxiensis TaxID=1490290 RepID=A0A7W2A8Z5_9BACL|nr:TetR/AcrR family transcriptional regulator [Paenactinomyces guangxiensis]MBA4494704.1 TetR/AcrR family transcriptional regulator [Paenactinomyces guangxiensis]MBH8591788.1 TetR/AcrR family transcriptional regulator [Paenactinomyces guangxiensis]
MNMKPNRQHRRRERTKNAIRQAAMKIFLKTGFHQANVKEIMDFADLGYGTFYQYYNSKLDVLLEQANEVYEMITTRYQKPPSSEKSIYQRTFNSIYNVLFTFDRHRDVMTVLKKIRHTDPEANKVWEKIMQELFQRLEFDITWSMEKGLCRNVNRDLAISALYGMCLGAIDHLLTQEKSNADILQISKEVALLFKEAIFITDEMPRL